jgi:hypothetical protein
MSSDGMLERDRMLEQTPASAIYARNVPFHQQMREAYPSAHAEVGFSYPDPQHRGTFETKQITQAQHPEIWPSPSPIMSHDPNYEKKDAPWPETGLPPDDHLQPSFKDDVRVHQKEGEEEEEVSGKKKEDEYFRKVSFFELFRFATPGDKVLIAIAVVCAMANGGVNQPWNSVSRSFPRKKVIVLAENKKGKQRAE